MRLTISYIFLLIGQNYQILHIRAFGKKKVLEWTQEGVLQKWPYRRIQRFKESGNSRKSVNRKFGDELLLEKVKSILYEKGR